MKISKINKNWLLVGLLAVMLTVAGWQYGQVRQQIQLQATGVSGCAGHTEKWECDHDPDDECSWKSNGSCYIISPGVYGDCDGHCESEPDEPNPSVSPVPSASPTLLCAVQGRKVIMPGNLRIEPASSQTASLAGNGSSTANPYYFVG